MYAVLLRFAAMAGVKAAEHHLPERSTSTETKWKDSHDDGKKILTKLLHSMTSAEKRELEHRVYHDRYSVRYFWYAFLPIAVMSGFQAIIAGPSDWCWNTQFLRVVFALWTMFVSGIACYWQWDNLAEKHLESAKKLSNLIVDTQHRLCMELTVEEMQTILQSWDENERKINADAPKERIFGNWLAETFPCLCCARPLCWCFSIMCRCRCWACDQNGKGSEETAWDELMQEDQGTTAETAFSKFEKWADDKAQAHSSKHARFKVMYFWIAFVPIAIMSSIQALLAASSAQNVPFLVRLQAGNALHVLAIVQAVGISLIAGIAGYWKWDAIAKEHEFACKNWIDLKLESRRERVRDSFKDDPGRLLGHLWTKLILNVRDQPTRGGVRGYAETSMFAKWAESVLNPSPNPWPHIAPPAPSLLQPLPHIVHPADSGETVL